MPSFVAFADASIRRRLETIVQSFSRGPVVGCKSLEELLDFLQLHQNGSEIDLIVTEVSEAHGAAWSMQALADLSLLKNTPVLFLANRNVYGEIESSLPLFDIAAIPVTPEEIQMRLRSLTRWRNLAVENQAMEHEFRNLATEDKDLIQLRDAETGLASHGTLVQFLQREWRRSLRYDRPIGAIVVEFQLETPDPGVLRSLGERFRESLHRAGDIAGRLKVNQIAAILSETDKRGAEHVAGRLTASLAQLAGAGGDRAQVLQISVGFASLQPRDTYQGMKPGIPREGNSTDQGLIDAATRSLKPVILRSEQQ
ncbi:MAG: GGDEF domain-containing protein [Leptospirales bacterium]|nr:GGDEF domain-containing protein [Leptospirales bacterium]